VDLMKGDTEVNMTGVIELLKKNDAVFKKFADEGTETPFDDNLVTFRESLVWK
jgi:hypothetical protein